MRYMQGGDTSTFYRAVCRCQYTREDGTQEVGMSAYGPYERKQDAKAACKRQSDAKYFRRIYPDYAEVWTIETLTAEWHEVSE